jgi:hypothetical protein
MQQHESEQRSSFGLTGKQLANEVAETHGLSAQVVADRRVTGGGAVALVE